MNQKPLLPHQSSGLNNNPQHCFCEPVGEAASAAAEAQKQAVLNFTCYITETSRQLPERFCPNYKQFFTIFCPKCDDYYIVPVGCHQRTCPFCAERRQNKLVWQYIDGCRDMKNPKLITLTAPWFKNLRKGRAVMYRAFNRLRHRKPFRYLFKKGVYGFHCKPKPGNMWYVHLHFLVDLIYIPQAILSRAWSKCLPGAIVADIRKAWSPKGGLKYILGYITATKHLQGHEDEYNLALKGTRLVATTGGLGASILPPSHFICPRCGSTSQGFDIKKTYFLKWHNPRLKTVMSSLLDGRNDT